MTLLIAVLIIYGLNLSGWFYVLSAVTWCAHVFFHDEKSPANLITINKNIQAVGQMLKKFEKEITEEIDALKKNPR
jgi:hypothetical protein